jgi:hypothetical protein
VTFAIFVTVVVNFSVFPAAPARRSVIAKAGARTPAEGTAATAQAESRVGVLLDAERLE